METEVSYPDCYGQFYGVTRDSRSRGQHALSYHVIFRSRFVLSLELLFVQSNSACVEI